MLFESKKETDTRLKTHELNDNNVKINRNSAQWSTTAVKDYTNFSLFYKRTYRGIRYAHTLLLLYFIWGSFNSVSFSNLSFQLLNSSNILSSKSSGLNLRIASAFFTQ